MSKDHSEYLTDEQIAAEIAQMNSDIAAGRKSDDELERDAYFENPDNADEVAEMMARMKLVEEMYKARRDAGLTQKEVAERIGTKQAYIAALEKGRKNITFATLTKYARACGKRLTISIL